MFFKMTNNVGSYGDLYRQYKQRVKQLEAAVDK